MFLLCVCVCVFVCLFVLNSIISRGPQRPLYWVFMKSTLKTLIENARNINISSKRLESSCIHYQCQHFVKKVRIIMHSLPMSTLLMVWTFCFVLFVCFCFCFVFCYFVFVLFGKSQEDDVILVHYPFKCNRNSISNLCRILQFFWIFTMFTLHHLSTTLRYFLKCWKVLVNLFIPLLPFLTVLPVPRYFHLTLPSYLIYQFVSCRQTISKGYLNLLSLILAIRKHGVTLISVEKVQLPKWWCFCLPMELTFFEFIYCLLNN